MAVAVSRAAPAREGHVDSHGDVAHQLGAVSIGSALIAAAQNGRLEIAQLLLDRGADVNPAVDGDENPLMNAAEGGYFALVQLLIGKGAEVHTRIWTA